MRVYIHDEEQEFTAALTWDEADKNNIEKLKQTFLPKQSHFKSITEFDLVSERGKEVTVIKNKMDIFVKKTNKVAPQSPQPQQTTSKQPTEGTTKKQALRPDVIEYVNKLSKEASVFYEKKKFNRAIQIYEELIGIGVDRPGCLINLGTMYHACGSHEKAVKCFAELVEMQRIDYQILVKLAESYFGTKEYRKALEYFNYASQYYEKASASVLEKQPDKTDIKETVTNEKHRLKVQIGRCLWELGEKQAGFSAVASVLRENEQNYDGLVEYGYALMDDTFNPEFQEALSVLLRCLVKDQANRRVKRLVANLIKKQGPQLLITNLASNSPSNKLEESMVPAVAWVALIVKEHSGIDEAISLYEKCLELSHNNSYILNLIHTLELKLDYLECIKKIKEFFRKYTSQEEHHPQFVSPNELLPLVEQVNLEDTETYRAGEHAQTYSSSNTTLQWIDDEGARLYNKQLQKPIHGRKNVDKPFSVAELDLLALYFTLAKILYVKGALSALPELVEKLEFARFRRNLHDTTIRNEHAYFCCISQIMTYLGTSLPLQPADAKPFYVCGESHCLSPAWQTITLQGEARRMTPVLVTGLKCWHLRKDSDFYPKANFWNAVKTIPQKSQVLFMFGEIDCREGIWLAVEKCRYEDMDEGMLVAIGIYLDQLQELALPPYEFDVFVHPVLPVLDVTRQTVKRWNQLLEIELEKRNVIRRQKQQKQFKWLRFFENLLTSNGLFLKEEYKLDGTHIHPRYVTLLERALVVAVDNTQ